MCFYTKEILVFNHQCLQHHSSIFSRFDCYRASLGVSEGRAIRLHWKMQRGWQLHLFIMWGTIAHLERQPGLVFSLILAPAQRARINREGRFICGQDQNSRCVRSIPQALNFTDIQYAHVTGKIKHVRSINVSCFQQKFIFFTWSIQ